jgi:anti-sigma factor (TIGR02949 family)
VISCAQAVRQLWEYLDGAVGQAQSAAIQEHLRLCQRCCGEAEFAAELRSFLVAHADDDIPPPVHARLLAALAQMTGQP